MPAEQQLNQSINFVEVFSEYLNFYCRENKTIKK